MRLPSGRRRQLQALARDRHRSVNREICVRQHEHGLGDAEARQCRMDMLVGSLRRRPRQVPGDVLELPVHALVGQQRVADPQLERITRRAHPVDRKRRLASDRGVVVWVHRREPQRARRRLADVLQRREHRVPNPDAYTCARVGGGEVVDLVVAGLPLPPQRVGVTHALRLSVGLRRSQGLAELRFAAGQATVELG
ncbi:MAG: Arc family DNA-binding protein [Solirubrobacterales bacterium]